MKATFKVMAYMGLQYQTIYIRCESAGQAERYALANGAKEVCSVNECESGHSFDIAI